MDLVDKIKIEAKLYNVVILLIEGEYETESSLDINKKDSKEFIYKNRQAVIKKVAQTIEEFSQANNMDKNLVKDYLLSIINKQIQENNIFKDEYTEAEKIILSDYDEER